MATNLLVNGDFQNASAGWDFPIGYGYAPLFFVAGGGPFGSNNGYVDIPAIDSPTYLRQTVATTPGQWYRLDFYADYLISQITVSFADTQFGFPGEIAFPGDWRHKSMLVQATGTQTTLTFSIAPIYDVQIADVSLTPFNPILTDWMGTLSGTGGNDTLTSATSQGTLNGLGGNDSLTGNGWADSLYGGDGDDHLTASGSSSLLDGGAGNDTILASGWGDTILGGSGNDLITVTANSAQITVGDGNSIVHANGYAETITGGNGHNVIDGVTGGASITLGNGGNDVTLSGWGNRVSTGSGADHITVTSGGGDSISTGGGGNAIALGAGGADTVDAGANGVVSYGGTATQYQWSHNPDGSLSVTGPGGTDLLKGVTVLDFADGVIHPYTPVHGDLNGDYKADLVVQNGAGDIWARLSTGAWSDVDTDTGYVALFTGNLLGDGAGWIVSQRAADGAVLLQHSLGGAPVATSALAGWGANEVVVGVADFLGNGQDSLLLRDSTTGNLAVEILNGVLQTPLVELNAPGMDWSVVGTGDFFGDGSADILFKGADTYWVWQMNGASIGGGGAIWDPGSTWQVKAIADLNGDGHDDLVWQDATGGLYLWEMNGLAPTALPLGNVGTWWNLAGAADITGDGKADLEFWAQDGTLFYWAMNGNQIIGTGWMAQLTADWHIVP